MEDRIRKKFSRYLALWTRERVAVVTPLSRVCVTFVPFRMEMCAIETLRKHLCYSLTSMLSSYRLFTHIEKYFESLSILKRRVAIRKSNDHMAPVTEGLV